MYDNEQIMLWRRGRKESLFFQKCFPLWRFSAGLVIHYLFSDTGQIHSIPFQWEASLPTTMTNADRGSETKLVIRLKHIEGA